MPLIPRLFSSLCFLPWRLDVGVDGVFGRSVENGIFSSSCSNVREIRKHRILFLYFASTLSPV